MPGDNAAVNASPVTARRPEVPGLGAVHDFAAEVGPVESGPVTVVGGRTQWDVGGMLDREAREVRAPQGIVSYAPAEMILRVGAGTRVAEVDDALAAAGQMLALDPYDPERATLGGVLAVGRSGIRRLRWGPVRNCVLEAHFVTAAGAVARSGGPVVKNVTGFDLCRLLVGSLGTIGFLGQVVLRTQPRPEVQRWWKVAGANPVALLGSLYRPSSVLWNGIDTWVLLEGHAADVDAQAASLHEAEEVEAPPPLPRGGRLSLRPADAAALASGAHGGFVAELGVGIVHTCATQPRRDREPDAIAARLKDAFDPTGRLNPGRVVG